MSRQPDGSYTGLFRDVFEVKEEAGWMDVVVFNILGRGNDKDLMHQWNDRCIVMQDVHRLGIGCFLLITEIKGTALVDSGIKIGTDSSGRPWNGTVI